MAENKCTKRKRSKGESERYWTHAHLPNMLKKAVRVATRSRYFKSPHEARDIAEARSFVALHAQKCKACFVSLEARFNRVVQTMQQAEMGAPAAE